MDKLEKVTKGLECHKNGLCQVDDKTSCPYWECEENCSKHLMADALELLKENKGISVDAFLQWCIESHRMGDALRKGIEYWINEFKTWKQK